MHKKYIFILITLITLRWPLLASPSPSLSAEGAILIEPKTNTILFSKNINEKLYPASTTKILTSLLLLEDLPLDTLITKSKESIQNVPSDSSHIGLQAGDQYTAFDGLHAILLTSDNFVSYDMAIKDAQSIEAFAKKMNLRANMLGATSSHFVNPHGYHDVKHYTTPYDLAQIAKAAFDNPMLLSISGTYHHTFTLQNAPKTILLQHTAPLLDTKSTLYNAHVIGVKTGFHNAAKRTLVAKASFDNIELIGVVMSTDAPKQFEDMNALFAFGASNYKLFTTENNESYVTNHSYSPWAKPYIERALQKSWIAHTTKNYSDSITKREMIHLIRSSLPTDYKDLLLHAINYNGDSIYKENLPATGEDLYQVIYDLFEQLHFIPLASEKDSGIQKFLNLVMDTRSLGQTENFLQRDDAITYEQAIAITSRLSQMIEHYDTFRISIPQPLYLLPINYFY